MYAFVEPPATGSFGRGSSGRIAARGASDRAPARRAIVDKGAATRQFRAVTDQAQTNQRKIRILVAKPGLDGKGLLVQMCQSCHNPNLDQSISRARFDVTKLQCTGAPDDNCLTPAQVKAVQTLQQAQLRAVGQHRGSRTGFPPAGDPPRQGQEQEDGGDIGKQSWQDEKDTGEEAEHAAAAVVLYLHIGAGTLGLLAGAAWAGDPALGLLACLGFSGELLVWPGNMTAFAVVSDHAPVHGPSTSL